MRHRVRQTTGQTGIVWGTDCGTERDSVGDSVAYTQREFASYREKLFEID